MFRAIPASSKLCFDRDVKRSFKIHQFKMKHLKSSICQDEPQKFQFLESRLKKTALRDARNIEIDRQNNALLSRIKSMQIKGGRTSYNNFRQGSADGKKSLNQSYRKKELLRIVGENQEMLKRLQSKKSQYSIKKMRKERKKVQKNISLMSEFKYKDFPLSHTMVNMWATTKENIQNPKSQASQLNFTFSGVTQIEEQKFRVSTYLSKGKMFIELEANEDIKQKYRIQMEEDKAYQLIMKSFEGKIEYLVKNLSIDREKQTCLLKYLTQKN